MVHLSQGALLAGSVRLDDREGRLRRSRVLGLSAVVLATPDDEELQQRVGELSATGVVVVDSTSPEQFSTSFDWEVASVRARRAAFRDCTSDVNVSALLCSNRPDRVAAAFAQLADQTHRRMQVVLVAHGWEKSALPESSLESLQQSGADVVVVEAPADMVFGSALSMGAAACSGDVVTKVDDDDVYGPEHVTDLLVARHHSGAELVGKALQYLYLQPINMTVRQDGTTSVSEPELFTDWVCGGTLTVDRGVGKSLGWFDAVPRAVDRNLQDKVLNDGGRIYRTHGLGYIYVRRDGGHTYDTSWTKYLRRTVEQRFGVWSHDEFGAHGDQIVGGK